MEKEIRIQSGKQSTQLTATNQQFQKSHIWWYWLYMNKYTPCMSEQNLGSGTMLHTQAKRRISERNVQSIMILQSQALPFARLRSSSSGCSGQKTSRVDAQGIHSDRLRSFHETTRAKWNLSVHLSEFTKLMVGVFFVVIAVSLQRSLEAAYSSQYAQKHPWVSPRKRLDLMILITEKRWAGKPAFQNL